MSPEEERAMWDATVSNEKSLEHPHEPEIPPALAPDGHCRVCRLTVLNTDLLAALEFCEAADIARRGGDQSYEDDRIEQRARAAIAKTKGES